MFLLLLLILISSSFFIIWQKRLLHLTLCYTLCKPAVYVLLLNEIAGFRSPYNYAINHIMSFRCSRQSATLARTFTPSVVSLTISPYKAIVSLSYAMPLVTQTDVSPGDFDLLITVDVWQKSEAETVTARRIGESVDTEWRLRSVEWFADANVLLVVRDGAPEWGLRVDNRLRICYCTHTQTHI